MPEHIYPDLKEQLKKKPESDRRDDDPSHFKRQWRKPAPDIVRSKKPQEPED